jgi:hypothetical protein
VGHLKSFAGIESSLSRRTALNIRKLSGAGGIRTPYLLTASQTFSQVNYGPMLY